jgi:plastocyanin
MKIFEKTRLVLAAAALFAGIVTTFNASARVVNVHIATGNVLAFFPPTTNISTGDAVIWIWDNTSNLHSTTSTNAGETWDSMLQAMPYSFTNTFNRSGTFPYYCSRHLSFGMTGQIIVAAPPVPPGIIITNPLSGAVLAAPANVTVQASVTNGSSPVTNVLFLVGSGVLTNKTAAPFAATTNNLTAGSYVFSAIAMDNGGLAATSSVSLSVVNPVAINLTSPVRPSIANFQFSYSANTGLTYIVQRSTNLLTAAWLTIATNTAPANPVFFTDTNAMASPEFYRVARLPNP